ncbi:nicotinate (nicotinamide) nucleotide adenylyltransferase [Silvibacterium sp.]|uniref:nicotinate (nicotinamide) nucleotide adenylyltransferase n=1 Tax=Silvibacterium sp. TaxID=1964179 RepID=UPI0039E6C2A6
MRIGFFGGSFDPPHLGHRALACLAADQLHLERVLLAPVGRQPLKHGDAAPFADRVAMLELAIAGDPRLEVSLADAPMPDGEPNYTVDTLRRLRRELPAGARLYCIMGADSFLTLGKWHDAVGLFAESDLVVGARPGFVLDHAALTLPPGVRVEGLAEDRPGCRGYTVQHPSGRSMLYLLPDLAEEVSATEIRTEHAEVDERLNPAVTGYIRTHGLYRARIANRNQNQGR